MPQRLPGGYVRGGRTGAPCRRLARSNRDGLRIGQLRQREVDRLVRLRQRPGDRPVQRRVPTAGAAVQRHSLRPGHLVAGPSRERPAISRSSRSLGRSCVYSGGAGSSPKAASHAWSPILQQAIALTAVPPFPSATWCAGARLTAGTEPFPGRCGDHQRNLQSILNTSPPELPSVRQPAAGMAV